MPLPLIIVASAALIKTGVEAYQRASKMPMGHIVQGVAITVTSTTTKDPKVAGQARRTGAKEIGKGLGDVLFLG